MHILCCHADKSKLTNEQFEPVHDLFRQRFPTLATSMKLWRTDTSSVKPDIYFSVLCCKRRPNYLGAQRREKYQRSARYHSIISTDEERRCGCLIPMPLETCCGEERINKSVISIAFAPPLCVFPGQQQETRWVNGQFYN